MRVFVTGIGRCGTVSFKEACSHITNYSSAHETVNPKLVYPDNHIEVNPHMRQCIREVAKKYPNEKWIHLIRNKTDNVRSLSVLDDGVIMTCYWVLRGSTIGETPIDIAETYYRDENNLIRDQLKLYVPPENTMILYLDMIQNFWKSFWEFIGAEGDFQSSIQSWDTPHNTTEEREEAARLLLLEQEKGEQE